MKLDTVTQNILNVIDGGFSQTGAFNLRYNGEALCHADSEHIRIEKKQDHPGINIYISGKTQGEQVHIPVVLSQSDMTDIVYNDFYIEDGANVLISAGCGIHNDGCGESRHDGVHTFHIGCGCVVTYEEKHYAEGAGSGGKILNPVTKILIGKNSTFHLNTSQIKGVDATVRETYVELAEGAKIYVMEHLMTAENQNAVSNMSIALNGTGSVAQIVSRSVAKDASQQKFHPKAIGNTRCQAHIQCDSIIMDTAKICSIPEIDAQHVDAQIIHEAAIGRINSEQLTKLRTFGLSEQDAEAVIIDNFLK